MKKENEAGYTTQSNEELFALFKEKKDERAFDTLYDRYNKRLYAYCFTIVRDREAAEDIFQTVMANVFQKRESFTGGNFEAWLFTIARNLCLKANRSKKTVVPVEDIDNVLVDTSDAPDKDVFLSEALTAAIDSLPEEFSQPIMLRYFGDFSYDEIADTIGISLSLVKVRLFRAKKLLASKLHTLLVE